MINKLLCIDDDKLTLMFTKKFLSKGVFAKEVITLTNGKEALEYYNNLIDSDLNNNSTAPQLILLDLNMPVMDGWEFLDIFNTRIYPIYIQTKIVILTSSTNSLDKEKAKQYPFIIGYILKPISTELFINMSK